MCSSDLKICDLVAGDFDAVVRYSGGNNAGHTITGGIAWVGSGVNASIGSMAWVAGGAA